MGKTRKKHTAPKHQSRGSLARFSAVVIPIIILLIIAYLVIVKAQGKSTFVDESVLYGSILILMVLMVVTIPAGSGGRHEAGAAGKQRAHKSSHKMSTSHKNRTHKKPAPTKKPPTVKAAIVEAAEEEPEKARERKIISYPEAVSGGKYGDAYIPIGSDMILKVRTILARSCKMCKNRDICWEKYKDVMDYQTFLESTECFEEMAQDALPSPPAEVAVEETAVIDEPAVEEEVAFEEPAVEETAEVEAEPAAAAEEEEPVELSEEEAVWD